MSIVTRTEATRLVFGSWKISDLLSETNDGRGATFLLKPLYTGMDSHALRVGNLITVDGKRSVLPKDKQSTYESLKLALRQNSVSELTIIMSKLGGNAYIVGTSNITTRDFKEDDSFGCDLLWMTENIHNVRYFKDNGTDYSISDIIKIGKDICSALILAHENGIIHRNIKPDSIYVGHDNYKLGDFGLTDVFDNVSTGNQLYAAPEQIAGEDFTNLVDIYSLGLSLYELCGGKIPPYTDAKDAIESNKKHKWNSLPPIKSVNSDLLYIINKACSYDESERYQSAQEFKAAFENLEIELFLDIVESTQSEPDITPSNNSSQEIPENENITKTQTIINKESRNKMETTNSDNQKSYTAEEIASLFKGRKIVHQSVADNTEVDEPSIKASELLKLSNGNKYYYLSSPYMTIIDDLSAAPAAIAVDNTPDKTTVKKASTARIFTSEEEEQKAFEANIQMAKQAATAAKYSSRPTTSFGETTVLDASQRTPGVTVPAQPQVQAQNTDSYFKPIPPQYRDTPKSINSVNNPMGVPPVSNSNTTKSSNKKFPFVPVIIALLILLGVILMVVFFGDSGEDTKKPNDTSIAEEEEEETKATKKPTETEETETTPSETEPTPTPEVFTPESFYSKSYNKLFDEDPNEEDVTQIANDLSTNNTYSSIVAYNLFSSKEYAALSKSDAEYVNDVYNVLFGRLPADNEVTYWEEQFNSGVTHEDFYTVCANSLEAYNYAEQHEVESGYFSTNCDSAQLIRVNKFVSTMYEGCLNRRPDLPGQLYWVSSLISGESQGRDVAIGLIHSTEFLARELSDEDYVTFLYTAYCGREPDEAGFTYWVEQLSSGQVTRDDVIPSFEDSVEFATLCENYGVTN